MKLENQVVSLELAKKLKELGVKQESEFMWVRDTDTKKYKIVASPNSIFHGAIKNYYCMGADHPENGMYQSFTVAELGEMLPMEIILNKQTHFFETTRYSHKKMWEIVYRHEVKKNSVLAIQVSETESDARAKMLIYLIESKLISV